mmetsp:Transcript_41589/g.81779  ORF Transcript_41589/g.81779 Transcript_41589/m.81779 type:complete len:287 (+) Transcript_41589:1065-1925(+)
MVALSVISRSSCLCLRKASNSVGACFKIAASEMGFDPGHPSTFPSAAFLRTGQYTWPLDALRRRSSSETFDCKWPPKQSLQVKCFSSPCASSLSHRYPSEAGTSSPLIEHSLRSSSLRSRTQSLARHLESSKFASIPRVRRLLPPERQSRILPSLWPLSFCSLFARLLTPCFPSSDLRASAGRPAEREGGVRGPGSETRPQGTTGWPRLRSLSRRAEAKAWSPPCGTARLGRSEWGAGGTHQRPCWQRTPHRTRRQSRGGRAGLSRGASPLWSRSPASVAASRGSR